MPPTPGLKLPWPRPTSLALVLRLGAAPSLLTPATSLRAQETDEAPAEVGTLEAVKVSIYVSTGSEGVVKVTLTSESDIFFNYVASVTAAEFPSIQAEQKLMVEFGEYANVLVKTLTQAIQQPQSYLAVFIMNRAGHARLDFIQSLEYKFVELLSVDFARAGDEEVRQSIQWRYNVLKAQMAGMQAHLQEVNNLVKVKNPSLLLQLQGGSAGSPGRTTSSRGGSALGATGASYA